MSAPKNGPYVGIARVALIGARKILEIEFDLRYLARAPQSDCPSRGAVHTPREGSQENP